MLTPGYITAKKGPLYTVWLAANWEKKLTKSNISDLNLESTIKTILSPTMQIALRTSAHLLLGVVRIYSKKTKYLLIDCSEAYVRIKSAFRPGIIDLPKEAKGALGHDPNILPVVFADFDIPINDILSISGAEFLEPEPRLLNNLEKITLRGSPALSRHINGSLSHAGELTELDSDVMRGRKGSNASEIFLGNDSATHGPNLTPRPFATPDSRRDFDAPIDNDFGDMDINLGTGLPIDFPMLDMDTIDTPLQPIDTPLELIDTPLELIDTRLELAETANGELGLVGAEQTHEDHEVELVVNGHDKEITREVTLTGEYETTFQPDEGTRGTYLLQPLVTTRERGKRKRKLIIDSCKVLTNKMIRTQLSDCADTTFQTRAFPPVSRRAILCKAKCADETLLNMPAVAVNQDWFPEPIIDIFSSNFTHERFKVSYDPSSLFDSSLLPTNDLPDSSLLNQLDLPSPSQLPHPRDSTELSPQQTDTPLLHTVASPPYDVTPVALYDAIADTDVMPEMDTAGVDQISNEREEELEERRWTQRVHVFLKTLKTNFRDKEELSFFSDLTNESCNRKKAATVLYSCLLLAKESTIVVRQDEAYGDIAIRKGSGSKDSTFSL